MSRSEDAGTASWMRLLVRAYLAAHRVLSAVMLVAGAAMLWIWYPPTGGSSFALPFVGGIFLLLGAVGVVDPRRTIPSGGGHGD